MTEPAPPPREIRHVNWPRRILMIAIGLVIVLVVALIASAIVPREWAQTVGGQADGRMTSGISLGLFYGFVFTLLPLIVLWLAMRPRWPYKVWIAGAVVALVLAAPNLMTLAIVLGTGNAAHAGERILDVEAPAFRGASLVGAAVAGLGFAFWRYQMIMRHRSARRADRLEGELRSTRTPPPSDDARS